MHHELNATKVFYLTELEACADFVSLSECHDQRDISLTCHPLSLGC